MKDKTINGYPALVAPRSRLSTCWQQQHWSTQTDPACIPQSFNVCPFLCCRVSAGLSPRLWQRQEQRSLWVSGCVPSLDLQQLLAFLPAQSTMPALVGRDRWTVVTLLKQ